MSARVLIVGAGDAGLKIAAGLAAWPGVRHIVLADARLDKVKEPVAMIAACGSAGVSVRQIDGTDPKQMTDLLASARADLVVQCASLIGPWATLGRAHPIAKALASAGLGVQLPAQLPVLKIVMECRAALALSVPVANLSLPDMSHAVLKTQGLAPLIGLGNVTILLLRARAALRAEWDAEGREDEPLPLLRLVGHHHNVYGVMQCRPPDDERDRVRVMVGEAGDLRSDLAYRGSPVPTGPVYNVITAAAALEVLKGLLPGAEPIRISAPAPLGKLGGYPVEVSAAGVTLDLPAGCEPHDCEAYHARMTKADGVEAIDADGTVHFTTAASEILAPIDPRLVEPLALRDLASRAQLLCKIVHSIP